MVADMRTGSEEAQKQQRDMLNILQGEIPPPSRVAGVMYHVGHYVGVIEPQLHTAFLEALLAVCKAFEQWSQSLSEAVSF